MVSICVIIDNFYLDRHNIDTMLQNCLETDVELLVLNNTFDDKVIAYVENIIRDNKFYNVKKVGCIDEYTLNKATAYNKLISEAKGDYICIFDNNPLVSKGWLFDLIYFNSIIFKSGISAICNFSSSKIYAPLLDNNDEFINVWKPNTEIYNGIILFKKYALQNMIFDENRIDFIREFSERFSKNGYENFYIPGKCSILTKN